MNCIFLLLLLSCCSGWGNGSRSGCGCMTTRDNCGCRREESRSSGDGRNSGRRDSERRDSDRRESERRSDNCGCEERNSVRENCDCGCAQNDREGNGPGMIPPPWQEYPKFPRRDGGDDCDCES